MAGGGPRLGRDDCCGRRPVDAGRTGAFILGGSDEVEDEEEDVVEVDDDVGRAGRDGGCFS